MTMQIAPSCVPHVDVVVGGLVRVGQHSDASTHSPRLTDEVFLEEWEVDRVAEH